MEKPSEDNVRLGRSVASAIGLEPHVRPYYDEKNTNQLFILTCKDPLDKHTNFYCTIGVSDFPNKIEMKDGKVEDIPVELLIVGKTKYDKWENVLSTCGFYITKNGWVCQPGAVFKNIVNLYHKDVVAKHVLFTRPFHWEDKLMPMQLASKKVHFLLAIPITDEEVLFKEKNGYDALENVFIKAQPDFSDLNRNTAI